MSAIVPPIVGSVPAVTAAQMAEIDRAAVDEIGISIEMLMENAARGVALAARALLGGSVEGRRVVCLVGSGNNGGDALGAARRLQGWGARVRCVLTGSRDELHGELNKRQYEIARRAGVETAPVHEPRLDEADLIVDGLLGYNVRGAPRGNAELLIQGANGAAAPTLAVDLPSGLHPDTGAPLGAAVRAAATVTLGLPKTGLLRPEARPFVGDLFLADIAVPPSAYERFGIDARPCFVAGDLVRVALERRS